MSKDNPIPSNINKNQYEFAWDLYVKKFYTANPTGPPGKCLSPSMQINLFVVAELVNPKKAEDFRPYICQE